MTPRWIRNVLAIGCVGALLLSPFIAGESSATIQNQKANADAIRLLTLTQRQRLERNFEDFQKLTPEKQRQVEQLHHQLQQDRAKGGELTSVMEQYCRWQRTLTPLQRDQLDSITVPQERLKEIKGLLKAQRNETVQRNFREDSSNMRFSFMPDETRIAILAKLESLYNPRFSDEEKQRLAVLHGLKRDVQLLSFVKKFGTGASPKPLTDAPPKEFSDIANEIEDYTSDPRFIAFIRTGPPPPPNPEHEFEFGDRPQRPDGPGQNGPGQGILGQNGPGQGGPGQNGPPPHLSDPSRRLAEALRLAITAEVMRLKWLESKKTSPNGVTNTLVTSETLTDYLQSLPPKEQDELLSLEASKFENDLRNLYLSTLVTADIPDRSQLEEVFGARRFRSGGNLGGSRGGERGDGSPGRRDGPPPNGFDPSPR